MASTPSASALSAVLRCRGNIFARNQANSKRPPAGSGYSLGSQYGTVSESGVPTSDKGHSREARQANLGLKLFPLREHVEFRSWIFLAIKSDLGKKETIKKRCDTRTADGQFTAMESMTTFSGSSAELTANGRHGTDLLHRRRTRRESDLPCKRKNIGIERQLTGETVCSNIKKVVVAQFIGKPPTFLCVSIGLRFLNKSNRVYDKCTKPVTCNGWKSFKNGWLFLNVLLAAILRKNIRVENWLQSVSATTEHDVEIQRTDLVKKQDQCCNAQQVEVCGQSEHPASQEMEGRP